MAKERLWRYDSTTKTTQVSDEAITLPNGAFRHSQNLERVIFPKGFEHGHAVGMGKVEVEHDKVKALDSKYF